MKRFGATLVGREHASLPRGCKSRWATAEHVVYSYYHGASPAIQYHSVPHACAGGADTLQEARKSYRSDMTELLGVSQRELPPVVEHLEAAVAGMWVRDKIGAVRRDAAGDRMLLQTLLSEGPVQVALGNDMERAASRGARVVVVIVEPDDTVGVVLDQMRAQDVLFVVHSDAEHIARWVAMYGPGANGGDETVRLADNGRLRAMSIKELTLTHRAIHIVAADVASSLPLAVGR